nr:hypothetical protein [Tanacetum cinerariifolium]
MAAWVVWGLGLNVIVVKQSLTDLGVEGVWLVAVDCCLKFVERGDGVRWKRC